MSPESPRAIEIRRKIETARARSRKLSNRLDRGMARILYDGVPTFKEAPFLADAPESDVIDPAFLPAHKYPELAGLTAREIVRAIRKIAKDGPPICGFDMACQGPDHDLNGLGAQLAARCAVEIMGGIDYRRYLPAGSPPPGSPPL